MSKFTGILLLSLILVCAAFAKEAVQTDPAVSSNGYVDPILGPSSPTDVVAWTTVGTAPQTIGRSGAGVIGNYMYVFGNEMGAFAQAFNLTTETWVASSPGFIGLDNWGSAATNSALYLVAGYSGSAAIANVQKFTPTAGGPTGTWTQMAAYPGGANYGTSAAWDGGNYIYCAGGSLTATGFYRYDIAGDSWTTLAPMPLARNFAGCGFAGGKVVVYGTVTAVTTQVDVYDVVSNTWSTGAAMPTAVSFATYSTTQNSSYVMSVGGGGGYGSWPSIAAVQLYNVASNTWTLDTPLPVAAGTNTARYAGPGKVISAGGYNLSYSGITYRGTGRCVRRSNTRSSSSRG